MASPGEFKGQRRGACGHVMAAFDLHERCARCRDKKLGDDPCVKDKPCSLCDNLSESQKETLSTPSYRIRKERKAGLLVSPKEVTVIALEEELSSATAPATSSSAQVSAHSAPDLHPSAQVSTQAPAASSASSSDPSYVTSDQFTLSDKMAEQFARFEALLSRGNIFSAPTMPVNPVSSQKVLSDTPFIDPSSARPTGPVWLPAGSEEDKGSDAKHEKKKSHKSKHKSDKKTDKKSHRHSGRHSDKSTDRHGDKVDINLVGSPQPPTGPSQTDIQDSTSTGSKSVPPKLYPQSDVQPIGPPVKEASATGPAASYTQSSSHLSPYGTTSPDKFSQAATYSELPFDPEDSDHYSGSEPDEGEISDTGEKLEVTKDMNYRETVRSVRSFMGWNHILVFEADFGEPDKSNNPWKGKVPARVFVAMPPDDWLCQKLERLNTTVAEGYPSRSQDSGGLKKDQFIKMPKSQACWYQMHTIKPDTPHHPGKSVFSWRNTEAKVNSQFPRITKASAYPPPGPVSRPISQEYLRRWE